MMRTRHKVAQCLKISKNVLFFTQHKINISLVFQYRNFLPWECCKIRTFLLIIFKDCGLQFRCKAKDHKETRKKWKQKKSSL